MAEQKRTKPAQSQTLKRQARQNPVRRRRPPAKKQPALRLADYLPKPQEFKADSEGTGILKTLHLTKLQQLTYLKWLLYAAVLILMLVTQDVVMSRVRFFGGTTDLAVCVIFLITILEGTEVGSLFVLFASLFYYFSGSSPGPYCIMLLTLVGVGASMFRQMFWHRSRGSIVLCAALALVVYEVAIFATGLFLELTRWDRFGSFLVTAILSWLALVPLYSLLYRIGQIGGNTWKE